MKSYELTFLITPELTEEEAKEFQEKIVSFLQNEGAILAEKAALLKKKLTYPIKKRECVYLADLVFELTAEKISNLEKKLKEEDQILRYLIVVKPRFKEVSLRAKRVPKRPLGEKEKKVELKEIEKKLEEILK